MITRLVGMAGTISLAVIIAGCSQMAQLEADTGPAPTSGVVETEVGSEAEEITQVADTANDVLTTGAATTQTEVEPDTDVGSGSERPVVNIELPRPENELAAGEYRWNQLLARDAIFPVYNPEFAPAHAAPYDDNELVIGVALNGEAKAYAIGPLNSREMVNDMLGGVPILVTW